MANKSFTQAAKRMKARAAEIRGTQGTLYQDISTVMSRSIAKNVNAGGRDPKWRKRKGTYSHPILDKTGRMRDDAESSAQGPWISAGTKHLLNIRGPEYGFYHQSHGTKNLPVRKYIKMLPGEREIIRKRFRAVLSRKKVKV